MSAAIAGSVKTRDITGVCAAWGPVRYASPIAPYGTSRAHFCALLRRAIEDGDEEAVGAVGGG